MVTVTNQKCLIQFSGAMTKTFGKRKDGRFYPKTGQSKVTAAETLKGRDSMTIGQMNEKRTIHGVNKIADLGKKGSLNPHKSRLKRLIDRKHKAKLTSLQNPLLYKN